MSETLDTLKNKSNWGGSREGSGRPTGSMNKATKEEAEALNQFKSRVKAKVDRLFDAQYSLATGVQYLIRKEKVKDKKTGKEREVHVIVDDPEEITRVLDEGLGVVDDNYYYITTKAPDNKAIEGMLDRTFGRAAQSVDLTSKGKRITNATIEIIRSTADNGGAKPTD